MRLLPSTPGQIWACVAIAIVGLVLLLVTRQAGAVLFLGGAGFAIAGLWQMRRR